MFAANVRHVRAMVDSVIDDSFRGAAGSRYPPLWPAQANSRGSVVSARNLRFRACAESQDLDFRVLPVPPTPRRSDLSFDAQGRRGAVDGRPAELVLRCVGE